MMLMFGMSFVSCSSDDDEDNGGFSGYYTDVEDFTDNIRECIEKGWVESNGLIEGHHGYYFKNGNTVESLVISAYLTAKSNAICTKSICGKTVYFVKAGNGGICSYAIKDNRIYITDGNIGTIYNNGFYIDGINYTKLK